MMMNYLRVIGVDETLLIAAEDEYRYQQAADWMRCQHSNPTATFLRTEHNNTVYDGTRGAQTSANANPVRISDSGSGRIPKCSGTSLSRDTSTIKFS